MALLALLVHGFDCVLNYPSRKSRIQSQSEGVLMKQIHALMLAMLLAFTTSLMAQDTESDEADVLSASTFDGLKVRNIGPALMSGRIADIAIHPDHENTWYVAVGSGGLWKTANAGTTWTPLFDDESVYSLGCVTIDPNNHSTIWVGTGENVGGRHVSFGDGVYVSHDSGSSWKNMGLAESEHISKIIVHPEDPNTVWVAAQGPLWSSDGDRGLFMTTDGGETWENVLSAGKWTGVTDVLIDPRDPDVLYAATWQRHRTVAAYMGGGPETGIHRSTDGGLTWQELSSGLPEGNMGKIGLAISPQNPDVVYAAIELDQRTGGVYRSADRGMSWEKRSDAVAGATGPHYYQELYASPHAFDRLYLVDVRMQISDDGGKNFRRMKETFKHPDNHSLTFRDDDPDYLLVGTDGGIYESFDLAENWRFIDNLPLTQFYKLAVDDAEPFYTVYGGTQDNNTQGGPSRTDNVHGIRNADWFITLFGDGHQPATEPGNPDIMYSQWQQGNLVRVDRTTGEKVYIQPQPDQGEPPDRMNWDAPILVSPHDPTRLYFASQRVWRSDNRGDSWTAISGDLTRDQDRMQLPLMGRKWSWDATWDLLAMSNYNTITSLAQSPIDESVLYAGTDDGLIQVTSNSGESWTKIEVGSLPGVPDNAFVNDIKADLYDVDTVYVALDNHKSGDFKPYLLKSTNRGKSWKSIAGDLPDKHLVWRMVQDHEAKNLLFVGTEFGMFFSVDGGGQWIELTGDVPTISFRDLVIQKREDDLVGASFGRGFFILDDISPLRQVSRDWLESGPQLMTGRKAWWYLQRTPLGGGQKASQGEGYFTAPNPPFGAVFTYYLPETLTTNKAERTEREKALIEDDKGTPFAGWVAVEQERREVDPRIELIVRDGNGEVVRRLSGPASKGFHRVAWDLTWPSSDAISSAAGGEDDDDDSSGFLAPPGRYSVSMSQRQGGSVTELASAQPFDVERMTTGSLPSASIEEVTAFWKRIADMQRQTSAAGVTIKQTEQRIAMLNKVADLATTLPNDAVAALHQLRQDLYVIEEELGGNQSKNQVGEKGPRTVNSRLFVAQIGTGLSTYGPTPTHERSMQIAEQEFVDIRTRLNAITQQRLPQVEMMLADAGAPWTPGQPIPEG